MTTSVAAFTVAAKLITESGVCDDDYRATAKQYVLASTSFKTRLPMLVNHSIFPGGIYFSDRKQVTPFLLPRKISITGPDNAKVGSLLCQESNDPGTP